MASIVKRPEDNTYRVFWIEKKTGKRRTKGGFKFKRDAKEFAAMIEHSMTAGSYVQSDGRTVSEYLEHWLLNYCKNVSPNTRADYKNCIFKHITPHIGNVLLSKLSTDLIQVMYNNILDTYYRKPTIDENGKTIKEGKRYSAAQLDHVHKTLYKALKKAVELKFISNVLCDKTERLKVPKFQTATVDPKAVGKYAVSLDQEELGLPIQLCLLLGLRRGEALGLEIKDVDFENMQLSLRQNLKPNNEIGRVEIGSLKTENSEAEIPLTVFLAKRLAGHIEKRKQQKMSGMPLYRDSDFLFVDELGAPIKPDRLSRTSKRLVTKAGLPSMLRLHDMRHIYGTFLNDAGENAKTIVTLMRLSSVEFAMNRYIDKVDKTLISAQSKLNVYTGIDD